MHLRIPAIQLRALPKNIFMDILCLVHSGQYDIPIKTLSVGGFKL